MLPREETELKEKQFLSEYAVLSANTKGRARNAPLCDMRTEFQRDRDKIIHSKAFRRLKQKTQVFVAPEGDHYRTRLTHTLEVSQIGRSIARALKLNEDLVEAIALGHDLGHTPFGHSGEEALNEMSPCGFKHFEQSLRVVDVLEGDGGLNLTWEVRDGIVSHTGKSVAGTLEGTVIKYADRIAYINHDIDDAIRSGMLKLEDLPEECTRVLGKNSSERINTLIMAILRESASKPYVKMEPEIEEIMLKLRRFLFERVYKQGNVDRDAEKGKNIVKALYTHYYNNPELLPPPVDTDDINRRVCDFIAGMSDLSAIDEFERLVLPKRP